MNSFTLLLLFLNSFRIQHSLEIPKLSKIFSAGGFPKMYVEKENLLFGKFTRLLCDQETFESQYQCVGEC